MLYFMLVKRIVFAILDGLLVVIKLCWLRGSRAATGQHVGGYATDEPREVKSFRPHRALPTMENVFKWRMHAEH